MIDFERLCDHEIHLPKISETDCKKVILLFRKYCQQYSIKENDIPISNPERDSWFGPEETWFPEVKYVVLAMARLLNRPRLLKKCLRDVLRRWNKLHGEVDFDDLFIVCAIRVVCPDALTVIGDHFEDLTYLARSWIYPDVPIGKTDSNNQKKFESAWNVAVKAMNAIDRENIRCLLIYLFPFIEPEMPSLITRDRIWPQSAIGKEYWLRIVDDVEYTVVSDQTIAKMTIAWLLENDPLLVEVLAGEKSTTHAFENLQSSEGLLPQLYFDGLKIRQLASEVFLKLRSVHGAELTQDSSESFVALWRLANKRGCYDHYDYEQHYEWLFLEIKKALDTSFCFANDLDYYWGLNTSTTEFRITTLEKSNQLRERFMQLLESELTGARLVKIVGVSERACYSLHHAVRLDYGAEKGRPEFQISRWRWLPRILVDALAADSRLAIHVAYLFSTDDTEVEKSKNGFRTRRSKFDTDLFKELFNRKPTERREVLRLLAQAKISEEMGFNEQSIAKYEEIIETLPEE